MMRKSCNFPMQRTESHHFNQVSQLASPIMDKHHLPPDRSTRKDITSTLCYICPRNIQPQKKMWLLFMWMIPASSRCLYSNRTMGIWKWVMRFSPCIAETAILSLQEKQTCAFPEMQKSSQQKLIDPSLSKIPSVPYQRRGFRSVWKFIFRDIRRNGQTQDCIRRNSCCPYDPVLSGSLHQNYSFTQISCLYLYIRIISCNKYFVKKNLKRMNWQKIK